MIPTRSANSPLNSAYLVFLIPTLPKYNDRTYIVVSVHPWSTDANRPMYESGPKLANISLTNTNDEEPDIGLKNIRGTISLGILNLEKTGDKNENTKFNMLLFTNMLIANIIVNKTGNISIHVSIPSLAPSIKAS